MPLRILPRIPLQILLSFALLAAMVLGSLILAVRLTDNTKKLVATSEYRRATTDVISLVRDAENGQRGFLITDDEAYLASYDETVGKIEPALQRAAQQGARGRRFAIELHPSIRAKLAELGQAIELERTGKIDAARDLVRTNRGKILMDRIRQVAEGERQWGIMRTAQLTENSATLVRWLTVGLAIGAVAIAALLLMWLWQANRQLAAIMSARADAEASVMALKAENIQREAAESQLRHLQKIESLGQLTGGIAHDFNNMLAVIMGGIELARRKLTSDPERADTLLEGAREGAARAATLTARLLAFSRNQPLAPTPLDVSKLVGGMCDMLHRTLGEAIQVECVYGAGLWRCYADPSEVENAVLNLAINARDAMPNGGHLTVETANAHIDDNYARDRVDVVAGQYVLVCVTDTGVGMPQDIIDRAFDPFFTTKPVGKGTGLGLSQVFGFVKQSGGHISIYSELGSGTTVKLYLPRFAGAEPAQFQTSGVANIPEGQPTEIILVVEDEQRVRHFAVNALRELGYTAVATENASDALKMLSEQPEITMLFTDIVMPDMTGRQLADAARDLRPDLRVLFTTGYTKNAIVHNGMIDIGVAFLAKPYNMGDLARKVRDVLDGKGVNRTV